MKVSTIIISACVLFLLFFLPACTKKIPSQPEPAAPADVPDAAPAAPAAEASAEAQEAEAADAEETSPPSPITGDSVLEPSAEKSQLGELDSTIEVIKEQAILGETRDDRKFETKSWFSGITCERYAGSSQGTFGAGTKKQDKISFKFTNNDNREYNLSWANAFSRIGADEKTNVPLRIAVNGRRLTTEEVQACCGTVLVAAGQTIECNSCPADLRYPEPQKYVREKAELINNLESRSRFASSQIEFKCRS